MTSKLADDLTATGETRLHADHRQSAKPLMAGERVFTSAQNTEYKGERTMKVKILLCNCKGLCPSFKDSDMNTLPFEIESDLDVQYTVLHPQLCGQGGNEILADVLRQSAAEPDAYVVCGACAPEAQVKLFKKVIRSTGFDEKRFIVLDIRGTNNEGILARLKAKIETAIRERETVPAEV